MTPDTSDTTYATADLLHAEIARLHAVNDRLRAEIESLRSRPCPYVTGRTTQYCTLTPFTLTDAEREAIAWAVSAAEDRQHPADDTLRGLLERTQNVEK